MKMLLLPLFLTSRQDGMIRMLVPDSSVAGNR